MSTGFAARVRGCLLGGAIGDALGWPVEFLSWPDIRQRYGQAGLTDLRQGVAEITDDTQLTLFTAEGLLASGPTASDVDKANAVYRAYLRWLRTQSGGMPASPSTEGWLAGEAWLYERRAPGNACLSGLRSGRMGTPEAPQNPDSKGCGAVMRSAPFGLDPRRSAADAFDLATRCATQTHGHPSGYLAAGAFAAIIRTLLDGAGIDEAVDGALGLLARRPDHQETTQALRRALAPIGSPPQVATVEALGEGWVAEEALAIGVYAASSHPDDPRRALLLAVNHSGDSDSTGSICGNLLGARLGEAALPRDWVVVVEGRETILRLADEFAGRCRPA